MDIEPLWSWLNCTKRSSGCNSEYYADNIGRFCTYNSCNYIFSICNKLKAPHPVYFISIILYDRYLFYELQYVFKNCFDVDSSQIKQMLILIQIATKLVDRRKILKTSALLKIFKKLLIETDIEHIVKSEVYVFWRLQDDLLCFDFLIPVEYLAQFSDLVSEKIDLQMVNDFLYLIVTNLPDLIGEIRSIFGKNIESHICLRILSASAVVCATLNNSKLFYAYSRICCFTLNCSVHELLAVVYSIFSLI
ncbi:unnamed protein product, partial [Hymenolepis diminuta]